MQIAPETRMGAVHLTVADLDRSVAFYRGALGLEPRAREDGVARLGAGGDDLLVLYEEPGAKPVRGHAGLYHFALLLPTRAALARWLVHAAESRIPLSGASDHFVSEAVYLHDPDWHGIEIYRDRPREQWEHDDGGLRIGTIPLDTSDLLTAVDGPEPFDRMPAGTRMGHVHLHVGDIRETESFYAETLGFDVMTHMPEATFMSAGGYHHHLGANVWAGRGVTQPPPGSAALRHYTIVVPDDDERDRVAARVADAGQEPEQLDGGVLVRDPAGNGVLLTAAR
jgi:catechol 2,3-dioxygenase